jgi:flagellar basal-body rod protein FlgC
MGGGGLAIGGVKAERAFPLDSAMTIAASGMAAATVSLTALASNLAVAQTAAPISGTQSAYQPVTVMETSLPGGGVSAGMIRSPSFMLSYSPATAFADAQGMVAVPNIDIAAQMVSQITASAAFQANARVFQIAARNQKSLIDLIA